MFLVQATVKEGSPEEEAHAQLLGSTSGGHAGGGGRKGGLGCKAGELTV